MYKESDVICLFRASVRNITNELVKVPHMRCPADFPGPSRVPGRIDSDFL